MQYLLEQSSNSNKNNNTISKIFGILIAGQRMFFIKDPVDFNMIFRCDKTKVNYIYIYIYIFVHAYIYVCSEYCFQYIYYILYTNTNYRPKLTHY
mgnify:CR=1 FL=1